MHTNQLYCPKNKQKVQATQEAPASGLPSSDAFFFNCTARQSAEVPCFQWSVDVLFSTWKSFSQNPNAQLEHLSIEHTFFGKMKLLVEKQLVYIKVV